MSDHRKRNGEPFMGKSTIFGADGEHETPYLTRLWIGRLRFHVFHRGDADPDAHDHPWSFWTFPLTSYVEEVYDATTGKRRRRVVRARRLHFRPATFAHRVIGRWNGRHRRRWFVAYDGFPLSDDRAWVFDSYDARGDIEPGLRDFGYEPDADARKIVTVVWRGAGGRKWGFWRDRNGDRCWVPWKRYVYDGGKDAPCSPPKEADDV